MYKINGINARLLACSGGKAEHMAFFFPAYYKAIFESYIPQFRDGYRSINLYSYDTNSRVSELMNQINSVCDYVKEVALKINEVNFPVGGYNPSRIFRIPGYRLCFNMLTDYNGTPGGERNTVLILPLLYIGDMTDDDKQQLIEYSNYYVNHLCNTVEYKKLFHQIYPYYVNGTRSIASVDYIVLTFYTLNPFCIDRRYEGYKE